MGDEGYFAFHFMDGQHRIGYMNKELELIRNYDILWQNWNEYERTEFYFSKLMTFTNL